MIFLSRPLAITLVNLLPLLVNGHTVPPPKVTSTQIPRVSPKYNHDFEFPLPIMPIKQPLMTYTNETTGIEIDFYEVTIKEFTKNLFPDLGDATLTGYDGQEPGPTFRITKGRETVIRFVNEYYRPSSVHLHGSYTRAPFDGWAEDIINPGEYKDYYYPNTQEARTLWYHDHAIDLTTLNTYSGQTGFYILSDPELEETLDLPRGDYDIPLLLNSRYYTASGNITDESKELIATYGDTPSVNGQILPYLDVEPRKYRFRILNASASRTFNLSLNCDYTGENEVFYAVGSDSGFMSCPVETESLLAAMAERWEIVIDFADFEGQNLTLKQTNALPDADYVGYDKIMQFRVGSVISDETGNGPLPDTLVSIDLPTNRTNIDKEFALGRNGEVWTLNNVSFSDAANRVLHNVPRGTTEIWKFIGGLANHPIHIHMVDFVILSRERGGRTTDGRTYLTPYEAAAVKDVVLLAPNEVVTVLAKYAPWDGVYMFHCHNAIHEDHGMMAAFNVTSLSNFGYPETTRLVDPMDPRFRAKPYRYFSAAEVDDTLESFSRMSIYAGVEEIEEALDEYWAQD